MVYLLENTLIFLPLAQKQHRQVSGLSIKNTCFAVLNRASNNYQNRSSSHLGKLCIQSLIQLPFDM
ncbi:hypothetical protein Leryth_021198 [Lithospermum erythrorhizon]|nr:hypothetical protein Leryth_021198 [Lithospermum erythrorhizon]